MMTSLTAILMAGRLDIGSKVYIAFSLIQTKFKQSYLLIKDEQCKLYSPGLQLRCA